LLSFLCPLPSVLNYPPYFPTNVRGDPRSCLKYLRRVAGEQH